MLLHLHIQNFAIVRNLTIDWQKGMTTITGETGAGKSIAIDALGLCLGERATTNVVRPNTDKADLVATFDISKNEVAKKWLKHQELFDENECILRRVISKEGRSKAYINGCQVPLTLLKEVGQLLINIHGQHDHQLIVKASEQRIILDNYAHHQHLLDDVKHYFNKWQLLQKELNQLQENKIQRDATRQLLQYQVTELDEFALQADEFSLLEADYKRQSHGQHILNETLKSIMTLSDDEQFNVMDSLQRCHDNLSALSQYDDKLGQIANLLNDSLIPLNEAIQDLKHYHDKLDLDPESFSYIEERYSQAIQLAKKHQVLPENLTLHHVGLTKALADISGDETRLNGLVEEIEITKCSYNEAAKALTTSRKEFAIQLSERITNSMQELNMPHGKFIVQLIAANDDLPALHGKDTVCFDVSINPGQALEAMHKVASGGELSRISLAMQVVLAEKVISPTMIFDEVDVGISGPTAAMVGEKLQQLGTNTQVICVTHLPQVACKGHQQLYVTKLTDGEHTETNVIKLSSQGRVQEIARLLAGNKITEHSLANAQELLAG